MKDKRVVIVENTCPNLLHTPHVTTDLIQLFSGKWQFNATQREDLAFHLLKCFHCRMTMVMLFSAELDELQHEGMVDTLALHQVTDVLIEIHQEEENCTLERLGAYAETIAGDGQDEAAQRFPVLSKHIHKCRACQGALEDLLSFLREIP